MKQARLDMTDIDWQLSSVGFGQNPAALRRACLPEYLRLHALSDEALLAQGLRREMIAAHVVSQLVH